MSNDHDPTDEQLARASKRGDAVAYDRLARRYLRPAMAIAWEYTRRLEDAEDVTQEAFHRAVRALASYDSRRPFNAWFFAIVRNVARSASTKGGRRAALVPLVVLDAEIPAPAHFDPATTTDIDHAIEALAPRQQACVRLCDIEGFTSVEAGAMLGIGEATVRTHLHRARKQLRAMMTTTVATTKEIPRAILPR